MSSRSPALWPQSKVYGSRFGVARQSLQPVHLRRLLTSQRMQQLESHIMDPLHKSRGAWLWALKLKGPDSHHESADTALELGHMQITAQEPKVTTEEFHSTTSWIAFHECAQSCPALCNPMDYSLSGSSVHGIFQIRILEWVAISFSRGSSWFRGWTRVSCIDRWILYHLHQLDHIKVTEIRILQKHPFKCSLSPSNLIRDFFLSSAFSTSKREISPPNPSPPGFLSSSFPLLYDFGINYNELTINSNGELNWRSK